MNLNRMYNKVAASFATGARGDLVIADFQKLKGNQAHVLMEYAPNLGKVKRDDVERYFAVHFQGKVNPIMSSLIVKPNAISIVVEGKIDYRAFEDTQDKAKMTTVIAGNMYLDNELKDTWEVTEKDGKKVLARSGYDDVEKIIAARRNRLFITTSSTISLESLHSANGNLGEGDKVKAYHDGELKAAEITATVKGGFKVKFEDAKEAIIAKESVMDIIGLSDKNKKNESSELEKYYEKAYGDKKYAKELTKQ